MFTKTMTPRRAYGVHYLEAGTDDSYRRSTAPLIIALRDPDDPLERIRALLGQIALPLRLVIPCGTYAFAQEAGGYAWFEGTASPLDEAANLAEFTASIAEDPTRRLVLLGQGTGGDLALAMAVRYPYLATQVIAINGALPPKLYGKAFDGPPRLPRVTLVQDNNASPLLHKQIQRSYHWLSELGFITSLTGYRGGPEADTLVGGYIQRLLAQL